MNGASGPESSVRRLAINFVGSILVVIVSALTGAVLSSSNRITALEVENKNIQRQYELTTSMIERNRTENRDEHQTILTELKSIQKEFRK